MKNTFDFHTKQGRYQHTQETLAFYYPQAINDIYEDDHEGYHMDETLTASAQMHGPNGKCVYSDHYEELFHRFGAWRLVSMADSK
ncbi:hypothetical protein AB1K91_01060 [Terribacillus sp. 179-K 1B1 HS]|uniref:hypothetical protein n=1 Tax=Terribacillus sp. 179-K 1B1 HS TaxID=3142388 RepID=UPI0039A34D4B